MRQTFRNACIMKVHTPQRAKISCGLSWPPWVFHHTNNLVQMTGVAWGEGTQCWSARLTPITHICVMPHVHIMQTWVVGRAGTDEGLHFHPHTPTHPRPVGRTWTWKGRRQLILTFTEPPGSAVEVTEEKAGIPEPGPETSKVDGPPQSPWVPTWLPQTCSPKQTLFASATPTPQHILVPLAGPTAAEKTQTTSVAKGNLHPSAQHSASVPS